MRVGAEVDELLDHYIPPVDPLIDQRRHRALHRGVEVPRHPGIGIENDILPGEIPLRVRLRDEAGAGLQTTQTDQLAEHLAIVGDLVVHRSHAGDVVLRKVLCVLVSRSQEDAGSILPLPLLDLIGILGRITHTEDLPFLPGLLRCLAAQASDVDLERTFFQVAELVDPDSVKLDPSVLVEIVASIEQGDRSVPPGDALVLAQLLVRPDPPTLRSLAEHVVDSLLESHQRPRFEHSRERRIVQRIKGRSCQQGDAVGQARHHVDEEAQCDRFAASSTADVQSEIEQASLDEPPERIELRRVERDLTPRLPPRRHPPRLPLGRARAPVHPAAHSYCLFQRSPYGRVVLDRRRRRHPGSSRSSCCSSRGSCERSSSSSTSRA